MSQIAGRWLFGFTIVAALAGSLVVGTPSLTVDHSTSQTQQSQASQGR